MSSPPPPPQPRGFPAPCWTHDETVALILAYREKWDSLGRRNLRSSDWDDVADAVARQSASASDSSPKSSSQCRHKIEKLRRRYRAEKQRCANFKGRVFTSWNLFDLMASIEANSSESVAPKSYGKKNPKDSEFDASFDFDPDLGSGQKTLANVVLGLSAVNSAKTQRKLDTSFVGGQELKGGLGSSNKGTKPYEAVDIDAVHHRMKQRRSRGDKDFIHSPDPEYDGIGFPVKSLGNRNTVSLEFRPKKHSRIGSMFQSDFDQYSGEDEYQESSGFRSGNYSQADNRAHLSGKSSWLGQKSGRAKAQAQAPANRETDSVAEMVSSSIRMFGDELVRVEKMKMDMVKEIEKMRMRMEMKRSEMIIKSEQMIVSTFLEALCGNKKLSKEVSSEQ